ncbi:MAG: AbrB/MazE/SpoVT family DNA-binding domain-containing protein [Deltaproteobacteria bacterium]|nr:AbrB/MazE/SpoVT family DNA-binding domain-containing protein [Deltaproteobacteria bacterium]
MSEKAKVLPKGQITIPANIRRKLNIKAGDMLIIKEGKDGFMVSKGTTLFDMVGLIPLEKDVAIKNLIEEARENIAKKKSTKNSG